MPVTNYAVIDGVIVHENRNGTQRNNRPVTLGQQPFGAHARTITRLEQHYAVSRQSGWDCCGLRSFSARRLL